MRHLVLNILILTTSVAWSQQIADADAFFLNARDIAFAGHWKIARDSLEHLLVSYPNYSDAKILLGKTYSWSGDYDEARKRLNRVTSSERKRRDAWLAAIKNEMYAKNNTIALGLANKALNHLGKDVEIAELREKVIFDLGRELPIQDKMKEDNRQEEHHKRISVSTDVEVFDVVFDPMYQTSLEYQRQTKFGKVLSRINYAQRFNITGTQFEIDAYPTISKTLHGYLNYGYSNSVIFPTHRAGVELYTELPKALELSLGARHMRFQDVNATLFTGSFGLYRGNYYLSARPFLAVRKGVDMGFSGTVLARKYRRDANNYFGLRAIYGIDSELIQFIANDVLLSETQLFVESQQLQLEYQFSNENSTNIYTFNAGVRRQELFFDADNFFWAVSAGIRYQFQF